MKREDELLLQREPHHPFRRIEFPRNFHERLNVFRIMSHAAQCQSWGTLAGGIQRRKCIKGVPTVVRQRVGIDFRLLFRLLPDRIEVIDLIPRQDLERRIKRSNSRIKSRSEKLVLVLKNYWPFRGNSVRF